MPILDAWPEGELKTSDARLIWKSARSQSIKACARHWWRTYLEVSDPGEAYTAWTWFLHAADWRCWWWIGKDREAAGPWDDGSKRKKAHAYLNRRNLERAMEKREEKFRQNFLYRNIRQDTSPWIGWRTRLRIPP